MKRPGHWWNVNLTKAHAIVFAGLLAVFTVLTFLTANAGVDQGSGHLARVLLTAICTITGPLTGAISRDFQGCCLKFSLLVMACFGPLLLIGLLAQVAPLPAKRWARALRLCLWFLGWLAWFGGGMASFLHALS